MSTKTHASITLSAQDFYKLVQIKCRTKTSNNYPGGDIEFVAIKRPIELDGLQRTANTLSAFNRVIMYFHNPILVAGRMTDKVKQLPEEAIYVTYFEEEVVFSNNLFTTGTVDFFHLPELKENITVVPFGIWHLQIKDEALYWTLGMNTPPGKKDSMLLPKQHERNSHSLIFDLAQ